MNSLKIKRKINDKTYEFTLNENEMYSAEKINKINGLISSIATYSYENISLLDKMSDKERESFLESLIDTLEMEYVSNEYNLLKEKEIIYEAFEELKAQ